MRAKIGSLDNSNARLDARKDKKQSDHTSKVRVISFQISGSVLKVNIGKICARQELYIF